MIAGSAMAMAAALWASAAGAIGGAAQPRQMGGVGITVYADAGFKGDNATFRSDQSDLGPSGFGNRISSLQVAAGEIWEVCANTEYTASLPGLLGNGNGPAPTQLERSDPSLRRVRNPGGGSALPRPPLPGASLTLYSDDRFRGSTRVITGPTASLGSFNDEAQSLRITGGVWDVCEDIDFGKCRTVDRDMSSLGALGLDKRISSVRPAFGRGGDGSLSPSQSAGW